MSKEKNKNYKTYINNMINPFKSMKKFPWNIIDFPNDLLHYIKDKLHNFRKGFHMCELWSLETSLAIWIIPRLIKFKEVNMCVPTSVVKQCNNNVDKGYIMWNKILDDIIYAFKILSNDKIDLDYKEFKKEKIAVNKGIKLFAKYHKDLWW